VLPVKVSELALPRLVLNAREMVEFAHAVRLKSRFQPELKVEIEFKCRVGERLDQAEVEQEISMLKLRSLIMST
jgi:hypothetical protein